MTYDLIIFDCDGTLVDSEYLNNKVVAEYFQSLGFPQFTIEYSFKHFMGKALPDIIKIVEAETGTKVPEDHAVHLIAASEQNLAQYLKPVPGAPQMVAMAASLGKICVASNGERIPVLSSLKYTGLNQYFPESQVFTRSQVAKGKPAPDLFLYAAAQMGAGPAKCLVIEDSVPGATAGVAAGMTVFGFTGVHHNAAEQERALLDLGVNRVFSDLIHITALLEAQKDSPISTAYVT